MGCSKVGDTWERKGAVAPSATAPTSGVVREMDQSKKTMRHFYCRDVLWETFEQMANDFDCSIDYLVNEAMRHYARSKNYQAGPASQDNLKPPSNGPQVMPPAPPDRKSVV